MVGWGVAIRERMTRARVYPALNAHRALGLAACVNTLARTERIVGGHLWALP